MAGEFSLLKSFGATAAVNNLLLPLKPESQASAT
jgi:hypothetical protein